MKSTHISLILAGLFMSVALSQQAAPDLVLKQLSESLSSEDYANMTNSHLGERIEQAYATALTQAQKGFTPHGLNQDELARKRENAQDFVPVLRKLIKDSKDIKERRLMPSNLPQRDQSMPDFDDEN